MKNIFVFILLLFILHAQAFWAWEDSCDTKKWYDTYTCRVKAICEVYNKKKPVFSTEKYENATSFAGAGGINKTALYNAQWIYRKNISSIYKCATVTSQKKSLKKVKDILLKIEKTGTLEDKVGRDIELKLQKLDLTSSTMNCKDSSDTDVYSKFNILNESTYEMCKYISYLEYLKVFYKDLKNVVEEGSGNTQIEQSWYSFDYISREISWIHQEINKEIGHTFKVAGTVFTAYSEYENNLPIHLFLQIIKEDYIIIREKLYKAINPINQVVYKISNAMKK